MNAAAARPIRPEDVPTAGIFRSLGEQLLAIARAATGRIDDRLQLRAAPLGGSETIPSDGGFLLQPEFSRILMQRMYETGAIYGRCMEMPILRSNALAFPQFDETSRASGSRLGGVQAFWENETEALIATKPAFGQNTYTAKKLTALIYTTDELMADSDAFQTWASYAFTQEGTFALENAIVNGTGAGEPLGVLKAGALVTVAKESGQGAATIVSANVIKMASRLWAASRKNAIWLYNQGALLQLAQLTTIVGAAGSQSNLWHWSEEPGQPDTLAGIPAYPSEYCQALGTVGDLILCDFSRYMIAMRERRTDVSIHVNFLSDESVFKLVIRVDGSPIDKVPVTPLFGSASTSPFVALATRS